MTRAGIETEVCAGVVQRVEQRQRGGLGGYTIVDGAPTLSVRVVDEQGWWVAARRTRRKEGFKKCCESLRVVGLNGRYQWRDHIQQVVFRRFQSESGVTFDTGLVSDSFSRG